MQKSWMILENVKCCDKLHKATIWSHSDNTYQTFVGAINCSECKDLVIDIIKVNIAKGTREFFTKRRKRAVEYLKGKEFKVFKKPDIEATDTRLKIIVSQATQRMAHNTPG